ncbi:hypothetical protein K1X22_00155 [Mycolicibacterium farcinogenes]|uniref:hypothetical protein n=1 Tax=Mycolicibacterium farcinogenes TaxID=1802 RepID=UPI001C8D6552|nr:hypothetical protein [Mycolicibacterium farcinogenes]QZH60296.1 hypothetical protein K1X22_00155 [Mycolicibacterium farcinogenes]
MDGIERAAIAAEWSDPAVIGSLELVTAVFSELGWRQFRRVEYRGTCHGSVESQSMDWPAVVSVSSSAAVALTTLVVNALSKRGDRQHATTLEFEKRVWESKSSALLELIAKCESLRSNVDGNYPLEQQQALAFKTFVRSSKINIQNAELLAYAAKAVTDPVEELQRLLYRTLETDAIFILTSIDHAREKKEAAIDEHDFDKAAAIRATEVESLSALGRESGLDVHEMKRLCDKIIAEARRDLRGAQDEPLGRTAKMGPVLGWRRYRD